MDVSKGVKTMYDRATTETASNRPITDVKVFWNLPTWTRVTASHSRQNEDKIPRYDAMVAEIHKALIAPAGMNWSFLKEGFRSFLGKMSKEGWDGEGAAALGNDIVKIALGLGIFSDNPVVYPPPYREANSAPLTDREAVVFLGFPAWAQGIASRPWQNEGEVRGYDIADTPSEMDRSLLKEEIRSLLGKASKEGWDGEGAAALDDDTVKVALELVDTFPSDTKNPDVDVTPYGEIDFDWMIDNDAMLTVSVLSSRTIGFSGLFHDAKVSGSEPWNGTLPQFVNCCFERFRLQGNS